MTTLDKVQELMDIISVAHKDNIYLIKKVEELEQQIINQIEVKL